MAGINECTKVQPRLSEYVDDALASEEAWAVKMHLASCAVCARVAADFEATAGLLRDLPRSETSAGFEEALARRLADQALQPSRPSLAERLRAWWLLPSVRPALAVMGALAAITLVTRHPSAKIAPPASFTSASASEQQFLEQCLDAHAADVSADPLGDPAAILLSAASERAGEVTGGGATGSSANDAL